MAHAMLRSVVADHFRSQELALFLGDVPEQRRGEGLEPGGELQIAPLLRPGAQRLERASLPLVLLAQRFDPQGSDRQIIIEDRDDQSLLVGEVLDEQIANQADEVPERLLPAVTRRRLPRLDQPHTQHPAQLDVLLQNQPPGSLGRLTIVFAAMGARTH
jgi:hypothetical protein